MDHPKPIQQGITLAGAVLLCIIGFFYFQQSAFVGFLISLVLAFGMVVAAFELPILGYAQEKDMLPSLTLLLNGLCGIGLIIHSFIAAMSSSNLPLNVFELSIGFLFLSTIVLKFIFFKNENRKPGRYYKVMAIPWLLWAFYSAIVIQDVVQLILPICLVVSLFLIGFIPWNLFRLPPNDKLGHRFFYFITGLNVILLALFSTTLNLGRLYYFETPLELITSTNFIILIDNILLTASFILVGSINISINLVSNYPEPSVIPDDSDPAFLYNSGPWVNSIKRLASPITGKQYRTGCAVEING